MLNILLLGANGQVGWELQRSLAPLGKVITCDRTTANLENLQQLRSTIQKHQPGIIVNAAAYTAVDKAETEIEKATHINTDAVKLIAEETHKLNAWFIHYSTDYVFDGEKPHTESYSETDTPNPQSVYGSTKFQGEEAIRKSQCKHLIFRTSWVCAPHGNNFIKTMLRLAKQKEELNIVADQFGAPTSAELIADITALCLHQLFPPSSQHASSWDPVTLKQLSGTYHLTPSGETNWHEFAQFIISKALNQGATLKTTPERIHPITTSDYPLPAKRPINSRLSCTKLCQSFNIYLPPWQNNIIRIVKELVQLETNK